MRNVTVWIGAKRLRSNKKHLRFLQWFFCLACVAAMFFCACGRAAEDAYEPEQRTGADDYGAGRSTPEDAASAARVAEQASDVPETESIAPRAAAERIAEAGGLTLKEEMAKSFATEYAVFYYGEGHKLIFIDGRKYLIIPEECRQGGEENRLKEALTAEDEFVILQAPVGNIYLAATATMSLFDALNALDRISFSSVKKSDWHIKNARQAMVDGRIIYAGKYDAPDYESLTVAGCSLALESTMLLHSPQVQAKLESLGIPVFIDRSSYETEPLGRTEWIKCYGALLGRESEAERFFDEQQKKVSAVEKQVEKKLVGRDDKLPTVAFFFINSAGNVVIRRNEDYIPKMIAAAGGAYAFSDMKDPDPESARGSVTISAEEFYATAKDADYLIYNATIASAPDSADALIAKNELFGDFAAVRNHRLYVIDNDLYQATDRTAEIIEDFYRMLYADGADTVYCKRVE